jgi:hypothetical protein
MSSTPFLLKPTHFAIKQLQLHNIAPVKLAYETNPPH